MNSSNKQIVSHRTELQFNKDHAPVAGERTTRKAAQINDRSSNKRSNAPNLTKKKKKKSQLKNKQNTGTKSCLCRLEQFHNLSFAS
jgi:hypothetical protein